MFGSRLPSCRAEWRGTDSAADVEEIFAAGTRFHVQVSIRERYIIVCQFWQVFSISYYLHFITSIDLIFVL